MYRPNAPLSALETTALVQIQMGGKLEARYAAAVRRLVRVGLATEGPDGLRLTRAGETRFLIETDRLGHLLRAGRAAGPGRADPASRTPASDTVSPDRDSSGIDPDSKD